ncbi:MAG: mechanosensitive ion channel family protein [Erythrobacteraceae bacterium]|jgi:miniconductance mechanosensitive channel|nr:mechanosensitive ion channel family protein [Erythrobacteraceae bacterium]
MEQVAPFLAQQPAWLQSLIGLTVLALAALAANYLLKHVILRAAAPWLDRKTRTIDKAVGWLATVVPLLIVSNGINLVPYLPASAREVVGNLAQTLIVLSVALAIAKTLTYLNELYERLPHARNRPIKGYLQVVKIIVLCGAALIVISILIDESPLLLLSGLGAITAVLLLVFKDTILSLVASVQLSTNDMLRVGDWIEMPGMNADGDVIDISLHTVKVQNFDKTITTIPTHRLVSDSYRNWRGMSEAGGRRIKRALPLDQNTIRFLTEDEVAALHRFRLLRPYLAEKQAEIAAWNGREVAGEENPVNRRRLTNIGSFRAYVLAYLQHHPRINAHFTLLVRQLPPGGQGLPLELYCFTDTTAWVEYESIQADIFDHMLAIMPEFHLRLFQEPTGVDFGNLAHAEPQ